MKKMKTLTVDPIKGGDVMSVSRPFQGFAVVMFLLACGSWGATAVSSAEAEYAVADCAACHESAVNVIARTAHGGLDRRCESCHGDVGEHLKSNLEKGEPGPIVKILELSADAATATCLGCHDKGRQASWHGGAHERRGVACTACHSVHSFRNQNAQLRAANENENCFECHKRIRAKTLRVSHHPIREGLLACASCHDPHEGSRPKMLTADWANDQCYQCHAEKRGPFLWEHAPVRENCLHCHDPHGSNHEKLLVAKQPYLCQRCHLNTRHPGTLYDATSMAAAGPRASNRAIEHACKNCHQNVHGSNAPSGAYLGR